MSITPKSDSHTQSSEMVSILFDGLVNGYELPKATFSLAIDQKSRISKFSYSVKVQGQTIIHKIHLEMYDNLIFCDSQCDLIGPPKNNKKNEFSFIFLDSEQIPKFILILASSGMAFPLSSSHFCISPTPLFSPQIVPPSYFYSKSLYVTAMFYTQLFSSNTQKDIKRGYFDTIQKNRAFVDGLTLSLYRRHCQILKLFIKTSGPFHMPQKLYPWLKKKFPPTKEIKDAIKNRDNLVPKDDLQHDNLRVIMNDEARMKFPNNPRYPYYNDDMHQICTQICKISVLIGCEYIQGQYDIVQEIGFVFTKEGIDMNDEDNLALFLSVYNSIKTLITNDLNKMIEVISEEALKRINSVFPEYLIYFKSFNFKDMIWLINVIPMLYARQFKDVWVLWYWIFSQEDPFKAVCCFAASHSIHVFPFLIKNHRKNESDIIGAWDHDSSLVSFHRCFGTALMLFKYYEDKECHSN